MKVLTWNCNMNFRKDFNSLTKFNADVMIIQESEYLESDNFGGFQSHWVGQDKNKGLAILTKQESKFERNIYRDDLIYFIPVSCGDLAILGVWAFNGRGKDKIQNGSGYLLEALEYYQHWAKSCENIIVAGDFNNAPRWDIPGHKNNFVDINQWLEDFGLKSAYHEFNKVKFGAELESTHFHQRNRKKAFHIDYIYSNFSKVQSMEIAPYADFKDLSDHLPVLATFTNPD